MSDSSFMGHQQNDWEETSQSSTTTTSAPRLDGLPPEIFSHLLLRCNEWSDQPVYAGLSKQFNKNYKDSMDSKDPVYGLRVTKPLVYPWEKQPPGYKITDVQTRWGGSGAITSVDVNLRALRYIAPHFFSGPTPMACYQRVWDRFPIGRLEFHNLDFTTPGEGQFCDKLSPNEFQRAIRFKYLFLTDISISPEGLQQQIEGLRAHFPSHFKLTGIKGNIWEGEGVTARFFDRTETGIYGMFPEETSTDQQFMPVFRALITNPPPRLQRLEIVDVSATMKDELLIVANAQPRHVLNVAQRQIRWEQNPNITDKYAISVVWRVAP